MQYTVQDKCCGAWTKSKPAEWDLTLTINYF
jgi:hypothetical protein